LRYEHSKLEHAKGQLKTQKEEIEKVKQYREDLLEQMSNHRTNEEMKRTELNKLIEEQKKSIVDKEKQIKEKNEKIQNMEKEYNDKLNEMKAEYDQELKKKKQLDFDLNKVREELEKIEYDYPKQIKDLRDQILAAKKKTQDYEAKT